MRLTSILAAGLLASAAMLAASPGASAGGFSGDRVYADSFGNLVVHSRSGYKRIVVGQGHLAQELADYQRGYAPDVAYDAPAGASRTCYSKPTFWRGRDRMYGLPEGEIPQPEVICE